MGHFEKLVVLAVLLVAGIVLAISFNRGDDEALASDPLSGAQDVLERQGAEPAPGAADGGAEEPAPSLLLHAGGDLVGGDSGDAMGADSRELAPTSAGLQPGEPQSKLSFEPESDPTRRILTATTELRPSFLDDYMVYTVAEGDTWSALAQRFYQDGRYTRNLQRANDDLAELAPGTEILVPVYDFFALDAAAETGSEADASGAEPAPTLALSADAPPAAPKSSPAATTPAKSAAKPLVYEVKAGDTLSDISLAVFGTASRWKELLEANREKLRTPESLQAGMKLEIPAGGKLPAPGAVKSSVAKKTETKPAAPAASAPKKTKKVL